VVLDWHDDDGYGWSGGCVLLDGSRLRSTADLRRELYTMIHDATT